VDAGEPAGRSGRLKELLGFELTKAAAVPGCRLMVELARGAAAAGDSMGEGSWRKFPALGGNSQRRRRRRLFSDLRKNARSLGAGKINATKKPCMS